MSIIPTFAEWIASRGLPKIPGYTDDQMVTVAWLQYDEAVWRRVEEMKADPIAGSNLRALLDALSEDIIDAHLGDGWFANNVDGSATSRQTRNYLRSDGPPEQRLLSAHRVHEFARRLYQLQSFPWFGDVVANVRKRDLSGAGFELDVLLVLHMLPVRASPRRESGRKGNDYDIVVEGLEIPIEVKAKDDDTSFSAATIVSSVKAAAVQLPKGRHGVLFLRIPCSWVGPQLEEEYSDGLARATRQTTRIGAIVTTIDKVHLNPGAKSGHITRSYHFFRHDHCPDELWTACLLLKQILERGLPQIAPSPPF